MKTILFLSLVTFNAFAYSAQFGPYKIDCPSLTGPNCPVELNTRIYEEAPLFGVPVERLDAIKAELHKKHPDIDRDDFLIKFFTKINAIAKSKHYPSK